jgi:hypothetical protein
MVIEPEPQCVHKGTMSHETWDAPTALMNEISFLPREQYFRARKRFFQKSLPSSLFKGRRAWGKFDDRFYRFPLGKREPVKEFNPGREKPHPGMRRPSNFPVPEFSHRCLFAPLCFMKVPCWYSSKATRNSSWVFITIGPYQATGSPMGFPDTSRKRTGESSAVITT